MPSSSSAMVYSPARGVAVARARARDATGKATQGATQVLLTTLRTITQLSISFAVSACLHTARLKQLAESVHVDT